MSLIVILAASLVFVQQRNINKVNKAFRKIVDTVYALEDYILSSFDAYESEIGVNVINSLVPITKDTCLVLYLPSSLCRACFSSLLFDLQDYGIPWQSISVLVEKNDYEVRSECVSRGIHYMISDVKVEGVSDIIITRNYRGTIPIFMNYNLDRSYILKLFLSDSDKFINAKSK